MTRFPALIALAMLAACSSQPPSAGGNSAGGNMVDKEAASAAPSAALLPLVIQSRNGVRRFSVEVAATPHEVAATVPVPRRGARGPR